MKKTERHNHPLKLLVPIFLMVFFVFGVSARINLQKADAANIGNGTFGTTATSGNCYWWLEDNGKLSIRPLGSAQTDGGCKIANVFNTDGSNNKHKWPWQQYKDQVKKIVIFQKIYTDGDMNLNKMFEGYPVLEEVDTSGLEPTTISGNENQTFFSKVSQANSMFANCPNLVKVDLSGFTNNGGLWDIRKMFANDPKLTTVIMNNSNFKTRGSNSNGVMMKDMFLGSDNLEYVDLSNLTLNGRNTLNGGSFLAFENLFKNKTKLHTVMLKNTKANGVKSFESMFEGCTSLDNWDGNKGLDMTNFYVGDAIDMRNMFKNAGFTTLDLSNFGTLGKIVNMDGLIEGNANLQTLILDNLDNSAIGPTARNHAINLPSSNLFPTSLYPSGKKYDQTGDVVSREDSMHTGAVEYGREIFGKGIYDIPSAFPNLTTVSAKNSNVWVVRNNRGTPGAEYYSAASDTDLLYMFNTVTTFEADGKEAVEIDSKRDYVDIITDRDSTNHHTIKPAVDPLPDASTNLNILYDLNQNGADHLASGVYTISENPWTENNIELPSTYYRVAYIGDVPFKIEGIEPIRTGGTDQGSDPQLVLVNSENYSWLNTRNDIEWPTSGEYIIDRTDNPIKITYEDAAIDVNGKKHNLVISINKITFKNLDRIPTHAGSTRIHDSNKYIDFHPTSSSNEYDQSQWETTNTGYYRTVLQASKGDGVIFRNYVRVGNGNTTPGISNDFQVLSGGSGTDIDFTVEIEGANPDTTFVFHADDLDIGEKQNWIYPNDDADYDYLPIENSIYGIGGEGFELGNGNKLDTITFAEQTGLKLVDNNKVITTGSDPSTTWSEFAIRADATGSDYKWTSGIGCTSYALRNTEKFNLGEISFEPVAKKLTGATLQADQFSFTLTPDSSIENNMASGEPIIAKNDASGNVTFGAFNFSTPKVTIDDMDYYPGTVNDETNTHGQGTHISHTYVWNITETDGGDNNIQYDLGPKQLKVVISTPENDAEMEKGIKADIYVDNSLVKTVWTNDVKDNKYLSAVIFDNVMLKEVTLKINWQDKEKPDVRPEELEGYLTYRRGVESPVTVNIVDEAWQKEGDIWVAKIKMPVDATVLDWGQGEIPVDYTTTKSSSSDVYQIDNVIKTEPEDDPVVPTPDTGEPDTGAFTKNSDGAVFYVVGPAIALVVLCFGILRTKKSKAKNN